MSTKIFLNLPVRDLKRSMAFFSELGWTFNRQFTDETAASMVISDTIYCMLLTHPKFMQFSPKAIADTSKTTEVLISLVVDSKAEVHALVDAAVRAGAKAEPLQDYGFMIQRAFEDLDGHNWAINYMDPSHVQPT
jgi:predicted lactoylglutathione lyase